MSLTIYDKAGNPRAELSPNDNSTQVKEIQGDNVLTLSFTLYGHVDLDVDDYVDFEGERYWLTEQYRPRQISTKEWKYDLRLYGIESLLRNLLVIKTVDDENDPVFTLTAPPREHVAMIVKCMNDGWGGVTDWKVGQVDGSENIVIDYYGKYCDEALKEIAEKVGAEYWIEGQTVNVCRCEHGEPVTLGYNRGLTSIDPDKADNVKFYTRLWPVGSSRNIDLEKYGHSRLQLPGGQKYVEVNADKYGRVDHYEDTAFGDIYPRRTGTISSVRSEVRKGEDGKDFTIYYFSDDSLPFDPNDYMIRGKVIRVSFQEGSELGGLGDEENGTYYFEVNFDSKAKEFEIITIWPYNNDMQLPGGSLVPKAGDKYILWNLRMPDEYYALAEEEFLTAVNKFNADHALDISVFKAPTDHVWIEDEGIELLIGRRVRLESGQYFPGTGYRDSRITKITRKVNLPSQMDIEIGDALSRTSRAKMTDDISAARSYAQSIGASISLPDIIRTSDRTEPTDNNLFSARRIQRDFLNKNIPDRARKKIIFEEGLEAGIFRAGLIGGSGLGVYQDENGHWVVETDIIRGRQGLEVNSLVINQAEGRGGMQIDTAAFMSVTRVEDTVAGYVCYFDQKNGSVANLFHLDDVALCNQWTAENRALKYYRRRVVAVGADYITLAKVDNLGAIPDGWPDDGVYGTGIPAEKDNIIHFGSYTDKNRQFVKVRDVVGGCYERHIEALDSVNAPGVELHFVGKQNGKSRFFVGNRDLVPYSGKDDGSFIEFLEDRFNFRNVSLEVTTPAGTMAGINGVYDPALGGKTIATWWGGQMIDRFGPDGSMLDPVPLGAASALVRLDGSMYLAKGQFRVDELGNVFLGSGVRIESASGDPGESKTLAGIVNFIGGIDRLLVPVDTGGNELEWAQAASAVALKAKVDLFSDGGVSSLGYEEDGPGGTGGLDVSRLDNWADYTAEKAGFVLSAKLGYDLYANKAGRLELDSLAGRVLALEGRNYLDALTLIEAGTGNAVTAVSLSADKKTIAVTRGATFLTQHQDISHLLGRTEAADLYQPKGDYLTPSSALAWGKITGTPTTLDGYGITDAYTRAESESRFLGLSAMAADSDRLDGLHASALTPYMYYLIGGEADGGVLISLDFAESGYDMGMVRITGNSYGGMTGKKAMPIDTLVQFYNYPPVDQIIQAYAINNGYDIGPISLFVHEGVIKLWMPYTGYANTLFVTAWTQQSGTARNHVTGITQCAMPSGGVTRLVTVMPGKTLRPSGTSSQFMKADGSVDDNDYLGFRGWKPDPGYDISAKGNYIGYCYGQNTPNGGGPVVSFDAGGYGFQFLTSGVNASPDMYFRSHGYDAGHGAWQRLLTETNCSDILDSRYVRKSGDTMTGPLTIDSARRDILSLAGAAGGSYMTFGVGTVPRGLVGRTADSTFIQNNGADSIVSILKLGDDHILKFSPTDGPYYTVWHAGNMGPDSGLDADLLDGWHRDDIRRGMLRFERSAGTSVNGGYDLNALLEDGGMVSNYGSMYYWANVPAGMGYGSAVCFAAKGYDKLKGMLAWDVNHGDASGRYTRSLYWRAYSGDTLPNGTFQGWGQWETVAFLSSNVASATKLQTPRKIFGNDFNGTEDVTGLVNAASLSAGVPDIPNSTLVKDLVPPNGIFSMGLLRVFGGAEISGTSKLGTISPISAIGSVGEIDAPFRLGHFENLRVMRMAGDARTMYCLTVDPDGSLTLVLEPDSGPEVKLFSLSAAGGFLRIGAATFRYDAATDTVICDRNIGSEKGVASLVDDDSGPSLPVNPGTGGDAGDITA